ncbi:SpaH/EbpB family LPXTG-anchored major pilin [Streptococcus suis]|uniref:SpaH/EbpB family LPXTG-anchored major pilin n=1 Tax=Streptococcus suis TaxID=1307 RepID=UPI001C98307F|nr:SpaH/EbpB family LPXTG-anchored major pilin [Streptococcus suis]MBY4961018.1 SpaH/EbpB family LPXTG-anchored major pilin [Streptococcus suis]MBY4967341.1 SpaH/EbpB family LPXTG-anchored major pilin [Streptococcus suis]MBY4978415.1 SpaH/EbpB family LPXTG-anchored major pilin [Streptococcus suis]MBY4986924.1 SpaH/EbpB family LPXTG-anchored major pilin [Streptococcus suis]MBY4993582.1 SpaH/EbpB family LPXTG-anchored major pilin [Streptococcus suis]
MKKLTKVFSLLTVLLTMFGPLGNLRHLVHADDTQPHQTKVVVHKVLMSKEDFNSFNHETAQTTQKYDGTAIQPGKFTQYFGTSAKEIEGVNFKVWKKVDSQQNGSKTGTELGITGEGDTENYKLFEDTGNKKYGTEGVVTGENNAGAEFTLPNGTYIFVEDKENSPYYNKQVGDTQGSELTEAKAVPFRLVLPVTRPEGTGYFDETNPLHVYPKNTEDKPTVTKQFSDNTMGPKNVAIGEEVTYKITTKIPKGSSYKTIVWEDLMVEGLDFVENSLNVAYKEVETLNKDDHYTITQDKRGFMLKMNERGLVAIETAAKDRDVNITLTYKGVLNDSAIVDTEIPNKVKFHYGNRPRQDKNDEPDPVTPKEDGGQLKIKINKSWKDGNRDKSATFVVYEKETGTKIGEVTINAGQDSAEFISDKMKPNKQYIVVENDVNGYIPTYTQEVGADKGHILTVTNNPSDNPPPIVPEQPKVITHGKRFIKTDNVDNLGGEKLLGAEFVVMNDQNQYLALKTSDTKDQEVQRYNQAEQDYLAAVKANNDQDGAKKAARDAAYEALNMQWQWVSEEGQAFKFISSTEGKFEVKGLKAGTYYLKETKAPEGYALPSDKIQFTVNRGSWGSTEEVNATNFQQVKNKKIIIPQTGGIGTLVFTVVGLSVMAFAYIAMKKRQAEDA